MPAKSRALQVYNGSSFAIAVAAMRASNALGRTRRPVLRSCQQPKRTPVRRWRRMAAGRMTPPSPAAGSDAPPATDDGPTAFGAFGSHGQIVPTVVPDDEGVLELSLQLGSDLEPVLKSAQRDARFVLPLRVGVIEAHEGQPHHLGDGPWRSCGGKGRRRCRLPRPCRRPRQRWWGKSQCEMTCPCARLWFRCRRRARARLCLWTKAAAVEIRKPVRTGVGQDESWPTVQHSSTQPPRPLLADGSSSATSSGPG